MNLGWKKAEGSEERAMEELFGETDDDGREDQESDYDYEEPSLYDEGEDDMDAVHERDLTNLSGKDGMPHPSRMDLESDIVERLTEPSEEMIERENAAAQIPSRLQSGEPEIPLSQKYDVEKWGRYLDLPEAPKIEPIHWEDVVAAFKEKGEEVFFFFFFQFFCFCFSILFFSLFLSFPSLLSPPHSTNSKMSVTPGTPLPPLATSTSLNLVRRTGTGGT